ncbi:hypothetical protein C8R44DRAFT_726533 [Mycena epipterygia]|nr:hypothetical protein C8R44DRAFT_726533 [Mycena epipterygia]
MTTISSASALGASSFAREELLSRAGKPLSRRGGFFLYKRTLIHKALTLLARILPSTCIFLPGFPKGFELSMIILLLGMRVLPSHGRRSGLPVVQRTGGNRDVSNETVFNASYTDNKNWYQLLHFACSGHATGTKHARTWTTHMAKRRIRIVHVVASIADHTYARSASWVIPTTH